MDKVDDYIYIHSSWIHSTNYICPTGSTNPLTTIDTFFGPDALTYLEGIFIWRAFLKN